MNSPVVVDFPLRGEWVSPNTPAKRVPSHGTDALGQRYAFDFVGLGPISVGMRYYRSSALRYLLRGVELQDYFGWGRPIYAATEGRVVQAVDGWPERNPVHLKSDLSVAFENARRLKSGEIEDYRPIAGNYIIVESNEGFALYAHAQTGSIRVAPGERVVSGQALANVGHSGNSTAPHLHFHLMDQLDPGRAKGIPCCFRDYEVFQGGAWREVRNGMPEADVRIRKT